MEPSCEDRRIPVKDLDKEESTNQELQLQIPPKPCTPAQPTAGDNIINTVDTPQRQRGSPFTVEGPIFYGTRQRGNEGASGANLSFLYRARPNPKGGTLIFSYIHRLGPFFGVQNFEFRYFFGFSEK